MSVQKMSKPAKIFQLNILQTKITQNIKKLHFALKMEKFFLFKAKKKYKKKIVHNFPGNPQIKCIKPTVLIPNHLFTHSSSKYSLVP